MVTQWEYIVSWLCSPLKKSQATKLQCKFMWCDCWQSWLKDCKYYACSCSKWWPNIIYKSPKRQQSLLDSGSKSLGGSFPPSFDLGHTKTWRSGSHHRKWTGLPQTFPFLVPRFPPLSFHPMSSWMSSLSQLLAWSINWIARQEKGQTACLPGTWILHQL